MGQVVTGAVTFTSSFGVFQSTGFIVPQWIYGTLIAAGTNAATLTYSNGTASGQVDTLHCKPYVLAAATTTIDLTSLLDPAGNSIDFARVREFQVYNPAATAGYDVQVYAGATNGWAQLGPSTSPQYARAIGGLVRLSDPQSTGSGNGNIVSGTSKTVTFNPGSNTITIYVLIAGGSVA
jgi:hypothetical protein